MYEQLLEDISAAGLLLEQASADLVKESLDIHTLEIAHAGIAGLFRDIRIMGVCRNDIETLNDLGLTDIESKYYSDMRGLTGLQPALEAEGGSSWTSIVMGGIISALAVVLAYFAGKLLGYILGAATTMDKASIGSNKESVVKTNKSGEACNIPITETKLLGAGYEDLIAISVLGSSYLDGTVAAELLTVAEEGIVGIQVAIGAYIKGRSDNSGILKALGAKELAAFKADASKVNTDELINSVQPSETTKALVTGSYDHIVKMCGSRVDAFVAVNAVGKPLTDQKSINAKSQKVSKLKSSGDFFDDNLTKGDSVKIEFNFNTVDFDALQARQSALATEAKKLKGAGRDVIRSGTDVDANDLVAIRKISAHFGIAPKDKSSARLKAANDAVRRVINIEVGYPSQYVISLINVVIARLLKIMVKYKYVQTKMHISLGRMFHQSQIDKLSSIIEKSAILNQADKDKMNVIIKGIAGNDIAHALTEGYALMVELSKKDAETLKDVANRTVIGEAFAPKGKLTRYSGADIKTVILEVTK